MKKFLFWSLIGLFVFAFSACKKEKEDPGTPSQANSHFWVYGGTEGGYALLLHTTDGGKTWIRQGDAAQFPVKGFIDGDAIDVNTAFLLAPPDQSGESFFYMSLDQGASWEKMSITGNKSGTSRSDPVVYKTDFYDGTDVGWAVGSQNLVKRTLDKGATWETMNPPDATQRIFHLLSCQRTIFFLWIGDSTQIWQGSGAGSGVGWINRDLRAQFPQYSDYFYTMIKAQYNPPLTLVTLTSRSNSSVILESFNGGSVWQIRSHKKKDGEWQDLNELFIASETEVYIVAKNQPVYYTMDGGTTWESYLFENYENTDLLDVFAVGKELFVCGLTTTPLIRSLIYYSPDGGTTWEDRSPEIQLDISRFDSTEIQFIPVPGNYP